jgi:hypothetical protein
MAKFLYFEIRVIIEMRTNASCPCIKEEKRNDALECATELARVVVASTRDPLIGIIEFASWATRCLSKLGRQRGESGRIAGVKPRKRRALRKV